jgi:tetratricopeptide (TPR) repeat protein
MTRAVGTGVDGRSWAGRRRWAKAGIALAMALAVAAVAAVLGVVTANGSGPAAAPAARPALAVGAEDLSPGRSAAEAIARAQQRVAKLPGDWMTWAGLGLAYLQQARLTGDPSYYPKADGVLHRSLRVRPTDNAVALAGLGALAAARHDFSGALRYGRQAVALDGDSATAWGVVTDACVELGRYSEAATAVQRMLDIRPDTGSLTRASYLLELHGDIAGARRMLDRALTYAPTPEDAGYVLYYQGELAWNSGDPRTAAARYTEGLRRAPGYLPLLEGRAKVAAARGDRTTALADYATLATRLPLPAYLIAYGDLLAAGGDRPGAERQYAVVRAQDRLAAGFGVDVDLELALFDADHGAATAAVREAGAALRHRPSVLAADAYGWALHAAGRDREALPQARAALRLGTRSALLRYHLGAIEAALGQHAAARRDLSAALALNPAFSSVQAPKARALLTGLVGPAERVR